MLKEKQRYLDKKIEANTTRNAMKAIKLLLEMNDITSINWKKMAKMMPSTRRYALDRAPTIDEMRFMITNSDVRFQAILLTMASGGIRLGAWDYLNWGHVKPINRQNELVAARVLVYGGEPEEYVTFITPEAYRKLVDYMNFREEYGEKITKDSFLMRDKWQSTGTWGKPFKGNIMVPIRLRSNGVKRLFEDMVWKLGFRKEKKRRHEFSIHSIRKFFKTRAEQVMRPINVETLMGHSTGISDSYYRPTENELLENYLKAVPLLSISESEELKRVVQVEERKNSEKIRRLEALVEELVAAKAQQALTLDRSRKTGI
jgi:hypothetical protein